MVTVASQNATPFLVYTAIIFTTWEPILFCKDCISSNAHVSRQLAYKFIAQVALNGKLQIKMHSLTSQDMS